MIHKFYMHMFNIVYAGILMTLLAVNASHVTCENALVGKRKQLTGFTK